MFNDNFFLFQLDTTLSFDLLFSRLVDCFGFVYLEDKYSPFIGIYPKKLWITSQNTHCYHRQINFNYLCDENQININLHKSVRKKNGLEFSGGYIGFISYDFAINQTLPLPFSPKTPTLLLGEYDIFIKKIENQWYLHAPHELQHDPFIQDLLQKIQLSTPVSSACNFKTPFKPRWQVQEYQYAFQKVQHYLYAGDCYQINLTQEFTAQIKTGHLHQLMPEFLALTKAPYAGYIAFEDFELLSCSPELFIEFSPDRILKTRPIKGTLPRSSDPIEDEKLKQQLAASEKDQAENLMIVDLLRNDLSVYAETGSVKTPKLFEIESFAQVHHMVSEIHATLKEDINPFDVLLSALPGGSITGAPKIRAMEIIDEIEGNNRGAYCGSLGYFNYDGTGRFNILIRSIQRYGDDVSVWAGGGITVGSNVDAEYQETLDKVSAILNVLNQYAETDQST